MKRKNSRHADMMTSALRQARDKEAGLYAEAADREKARADAAEARAKELEAQCAEMREALKDVQYVLDHVRPFTTQVWGNPACSLEARDLEEVSETVKAALSGDAGRALMERVEALERDIADKSERCRRGAHALIELIGASRPEHIDETCARAARRLEALELIADIARNRGRPTDELGCAVDALDALEAKQ